MAFQVKPARARPKQHVSTEVVMDSGKLGVHHNLSAPSFEIDYVKGEQIGNLKQRLCDHLSTAKQPVHTVQMTVTHDSRALVDIFSVDDYKIIGGETLTVEYTKPMRVYARISVFGEVEKSGTLRTAGVDHNCSFEKQKPLCFPDARSSDILCLEIVEKTKNIPIGGHSLLLEDVFFKMCQLSQNEITMRVATCSKDGDFSGSVQLTISRPVTGGFNIQIGMCESLRDTSIITAIQGQVDWPLFQVGAGIIVVYYIIGCLVYSLVAFPFSPTSIECATVYSCSNNTLNATEVCIELEDLTNASEKFADAIYFSTVTLTTVGYGDIVPYGDSLRFFTVLFVVFGVGIVGPAVGVLLSTCSALKYRAKRSAYKRDTVRMLHGMQFRQCCAEATTYYIFGAAVVVGIIYFYSEGLQSGRSAASAFASAIYYTVITGTTVGYGDFSPQSPAGRVVACAYLLVATTVLSIFFNKISSYVIDAREDVRRKQALASYGKGLDKDELKGLVQETCTMFSDDGSSCSKAEFVVFMALRANIVEQQDVDECLAAFRKLDKNKSGTLTLEDCVFIPEGAVKGKDVQQVYRDLEQQIDKSEESAARDVAAAVAQEEEDAQT